MAFSLISLPSSGLRSRDTPLYPLRKLMQAFLETRSAGLQSHFSPLPTRLQPQRHSGHNARVDGYRHVVSVVSSWFLSSIAALPSAIMARRCMWTRGVFSSRKCTEPSVSKIASTRMQATWPRPAADTARSGPEEDGRYCFRNSASRGPTVSCCWCTVCDVQIIELRVLRAVEEQPKPQ